MNLLALSPYVFGNDGLTWYSICVLTGAIITLIISNFLYKKNPESKKCPDLILDTFLVGFPTGLLGARIWYVLSEWDYYYENPIQILKVWQGGLAIQGGVLLGAACGISFVIYKIRKHGINLKVTTIMDMVIPNILIAQVIGRWGNFFNREVYGACVSQEYVDKNWWWIPNFIVEYMRGGTISGEYIACSSSQFAQPLFLYEGLLNLLGFIIISIVLRKFFTKRIDGTLSGLYLVWYGVIRVSMENLRNEMFIMRWGKLSQSVITSIAYIILGVSYIAYLYISYYRNKNKLVEKNITLDVVENKDNESSLDIKEETNEFKNEEVKEKTVSKTTRKKKNSEKKDSESNE